MDERNLLWVSAKWAGTWYCESCFERIISDLSHVNAALILWVRRFVLVYTKSILWQAATKDRAIPIVYSLQRQIIRDHKVARYGIWYTNAIALGMTTEWGYRLIGFAYVKWYVISSCCAKALILFSKRHVTDSERRSYIARISFWIGYLTDRWL